MRAINQKTFTLAAYETKRNQMVRHATSHLKMRLLLVALLGSSKDYYCGNELPSDNRDPDRMNELSSYFERNPMLFVDKFSDR